MKAQMMFCSVKLEKSLMSSDMTNDESQHQTKIDMQDDVLQCDYLEVIEVPRQCQEKCSNFSIDYILGNCNKKESHFDSAKVHYDWLNYTRYRPPKLQSEY